MPTSLAFDELNSSLNTRLEVPLAAFPLCIQSQRDTQKTGFLPALISRQQRLYWPQLKCQLSQPEAKLSSWHRKADRASAGAGRSLGNGQGRDGEAVSVCTKKKQRPCYQNRDIYKQADIPQNKVLSLSSFPSSVCVWQGGRSLLKRQKQTLVLGYQSQDVYRQSVVVLI